MKWTEFEFVVAEKGEMFLNLFDKRNLPEQIIEKAHLFHVFTFICAGMPDSMSDRICRCEADKCASK